jgi:hypothetical protein
LLLLKGKMQDAQPQSLPKILLLGDPYQLRRGAKREKSAGRPDIPTATDPFPYS